MRLAVPFQAPQQSPAYQALLRFVQSRRGDDGALRELLWRIGAQPLLIAHEHLFENLLAFLYASPLHIANLAWASAWKNGIEPWQQILRFLSDAKEQIANLEGLEHFQAEPANAHDHPFLGTHIDRHPIAAALWNRHHSVTEYPPAEENSVGLAYFHLQAHLLCAYFEAREHAKVGLAGFETYVGAREFAPVPIGAGPVGRTVREFSLPAYDDLLRQLPRDKSTKDFAKSLLNVPLDLRYVPGTSRERAQHYFENLVVYFAHIYNLLGLDKVDPRRGSGSPIKTDGGSESRPGFVHFEGGILSIADIENPTGEDFPEGAYQSVKLSFRSDADDTPEAMEKSGLAPQEQSEDLLDLYSPEEAARKLSQVKYQRQALEMAANRFWWDRGNLTPLQMQTFWRIADHTIDVWNTADRPSPDDRDRACGALLLKGMLLLGQNRERIRQLRFEIVTPPLDEALERLCLLDRDHLSLVLASADRESLADARPIAFLIPAIQPEFRANLPDATLALGRPRQARLALPDLSNFGAQLLCWLRHRERHQNPDGTILGIHPGTADTSLDEFLTTYDTAVHSGLRLSESAFPRWLGVTCELISGDQSLAWVLTGNPDRRHEARMHYTQHMAARLLHIYVLAIRRLQNTIQLRTHLYWMRP